MRPDDRGLQSLAAATAAAAAPPVPDPARPVPGSRVAAEVLAVEGPDSSGIGFADGRLRRRGRARPRRGVMLVSSVVLIAAIAGVAIVGLGAGPRGGAGPVTSPSAGAASASPRGAGSPDPSTSLAVTARPNAPRASSPGSDMFPYHGSAGVRPN